MIRHLVFLQFAQDTREDDKDDLYAALAGLRAHLNGVVDFQSRKNISPEDPLVRDFRDMFWFDFKDKTARDAYLEDAAHQAIGKRTIEKLAQGVESVFVCDIEL